MQPGEIVSKQKERRKRLKMLKKDQPHLIIIEDPLNVAQIYISFDEEKTEIQS
jgi:hypothetical protein